MSDDPQHGPAAAAAPADAGSDGPRDGAIPRYSRRLSDRVLICFHQACDSNDHEVARRLLDIFEFIMTRRDLPSETNRRRDLGSLVAAHERLWMLRHPG